uniref:Uncharacterized protein n=1 Tax=Magallana gigas TaxID=29159 RepID=A0A8W8JQ71_MAGGI
VVCIPTPEFNIVSFNSTLGCLRKPLSEIYGVSVRLNETRVQYCLDPYNFREIFLPLIHSLIELILSLNII